MNNVQIPVRIRCCAWSKGGVPVNQSTLLLVSLKQPVWCFSWPLLSPAAPRSSQLADADPLTATSGLLGAGLDCCQRHGSWHGHSASEDDSPLLEDPATSHHRPRELSHTLH
jgi:hypothetical protein